jgi:type I restriction enzyme, S subunit
MFRKLFLSKKIIDKTKQVGVQKMALNRLSSTMIPLSPLAEQRQIVEKIDRLMGMCDRLEESISSGKGKQTDLLNALMSQV